MQTFFALGAFCGFASLIWLLVRKHQAAAQQLTLTTARAIAGGLDVLVQYKPGRARVGLRARVQLIEPSDASLLTGVRRERGDRYGAYIVSEPNQEIRGSTVDFALRHLRPDPPGVVCGVFYVTGSDNAPPTSARVKLEIWTDAGPTRLIQRDATLRVINF